MSQALLLPLLEGITAGLIVVAGFLFVYSRFQKKAATGVLAEARADAARIRADASQGVERARAEAVLAAKMEAVQVREALEQELLRRREEVGRLERRVEERNQVLERRQAELDTQQRELGKRVQQLDARDKQIAGREQDAARFAAEQQARLEQIAGLTAADARQQLLQRVEDEARGAAQALARDIKDQARKGADREARRIISMAAQRIAAEHTAETTVSAVTLPSDEMKGRIIGREGRNIRAFEQLTGINLIIDDTPEAVILSSFDPVRREIGRITLESLIADGRIHPARIEEMFKKAETLVEQQVHEAGEQAVFDTGVHNLHNDLVRTLGRLRYRTSYGQNVLKHSLEVAYLAGVMAAELGVDPKLAKRAGLLHDLGKAIDHEVEGPHAVIGADLARRLGENKEVLHCIEAHHGDVEPQTVEAVIVQAADAISAARPGARRETLESYIKRLEKLESLAESQPGVEKSYAMQAGREIRVMVKPDEISDAAATVMARDLAKKIEEELQYPGQIKVMIIRESRAVEYAK